MSDSIYIKDGRLLFKVTLAEIQYIESAHRYVRFVTAERTYMSETSLIEVEGKLPQDQFCRIHRYYIISFKYARQLAPKAVIVGERELPIGKKYKGCLWAKLATICVGLELGESVLNLI